MIEPGGLAPLPDRDRPSSWLELSHASTAHPLIVVVPERRMLAIHGSGTRVAADFRMATTVLRSVGEILRGALPRDRRPDPRTVLEVCWAFEFDPDGRLDLETVARSLEQPRRRWRQMTEVPAAANEARVTDAIDLARRQAGRSIPLVHPIHVSEGPAAQILHLSTEVEAETVRRLYQYILDAGLRPAGDLHEFVLADPETVGRGRGRSILRVPVATA